MNCSQSKVERSCYIVVVVHEGVLSWISTMLQANMLCCLFCILRHNFLNNSHWHLLLKCWDEKSTNSTSCLSQTTVDMIFWVENDWHLFLLLKCVYTLWIISSTWRLRTTPIFHLQTSLLCSLYFITHLYNLY